MTIKTRFYCSDYKVRAMCIKHGYCTMCDIDQYADILRLADGEITKNTVLEIAKRIAHYSDSARWMASTGCLYVEFVEQIAYDILNDCCGILVEVGE